MVHENIPNEFSDHKNLILTNLCVKTAVRIVNAVKVFIRFIVSSMYISMAKNYFD